MRQQQESQVLVRRGAVDGVAAEQCRRVDQVDHGVGAWQARGADREAQCVRAKLQRHVLQEFHRPEVECPPVNLLVQRHEQPHIVPGRVQVLGQGAGHVGKATGLGQWRDFRGNQADAKRHGESVAVSSLDAARVDRHRHAGPGGRRTFGWDAGRTLAVLAASLAMAFRPAGLAGEAGWPDSQSATCGRARCIDSRHGPDAGLAGTGHRHVGVDGGRCNRPYPRLLRGWLG